MRRRRRSQRRFIRKMKKETGKGTRREGNEDGERRKESGKEPRPGGSEHAR